MISSECACEIRIRLNGRQIRSVDMPSSTAYPMSHASGGVCSLCPAHKLSICEAAKAQSGAIKQSAYSVPARQIVFYERQLSDTVPIICKGWAASIIELPASRRQILSILLAGDLVSTALITGPRPNCLVEAITEVHYRTFDRRDLKSALQNDPVLFDTYLRIWHNERIGIDQVLASLGRQTADERVAQLITNLVDRLRQRGMLPSRSKMPFPLRQHQIADATGLTTVHVNKVLKDFRRKGLLEIFDREISILDEEKFRRVSKPHSMAHT
jgi:CRP-like cAMP-binding protein